LTVLINTGLLESTVGVITTSVNTSVGLTDLSESTGGVLFTIVVRNGLAFDEWISSEVGNAFTAGSVIEGLAVGIHSATVWQ
jgi:hypothetical protein